MRERFPKKCWEELKILDTRVPDKKKNWVTQIKDKVDQYRFGNVNIDLLKQENIQHDILKEIRKQDFENYLSRLMNSSYSEIYKEIKEGRSMETVQ